MSLYLSTLLLFINHFLLFNYMYFLSHSFHKIVIIYNEFSVYKELLSETHVKDNIKK
jgi:hypothetical protein